VFWDVTVCHNVSTSWGLISDCLTLKMYTLWFFKISGNHFHIDTAIHSRKCISSAKNLILQSYRFLHSVCVCVCVCQKDRDRNSDKETDREHPSCELEMKWLVFIKLSLKWNGNYDSILFCSSMYWVIIRRVKLRRVKIINVNSPQILNKTLQFFTEEYSNFYSTPCGYGTKTLK